MSNNKDTVDKINNIVSNLDNIIGTVKESENIHDVIERIKKTSDTENVNIDIEDKLGEKVEYDSGVEIRQKIDSTELGDIELRRVGNTITIKPIDNIKSYDFDLPNGSYDIDRSDAKINNGVLTVRIPKEGEDFEFQSFSLGGEENGSSE